MDKLPLEIITHILKYLPTEDRLKMALVNKKFHYASLHPQLIMNDLFTYNETLLFRSKCLPTDSQLRSKYNEFSEMLTNSQRSIVHLKYYEIKLDGVDYVPLIEHLGVRLESLTITRLCLLSDVFLDSITNCCDNLKALELEEIDTCILTVKSRKPLLKLNRMTFNRVIMCDFEFNQIVKCAPNLKDFGLYNCYLLEWRQALIRFYPSYRNPQSSPDYNSCSVFTITNINSFLEKCKRIDCLRLNNYYDIFFKLPKHIKLKTLVLDTLNCVIPIDDSFINTLGEHTSLERLELHYFPCTVLSVVSKMRNLKYLKLKFICKVSLSVKDENCLNAFIDSMYGNLKHIRELILVPTTSLTVVCASQNQISDYVLNSLTLLSCSIGNCMNVIYCGRNLTTLNIHSCNIMSSSEFKSLFRNLTNLTHLELADCTNLDDELFMAMNISNVKRLITLKISDVDLTYRCLKGIKLSYLKNLFISKISCEGSSNDDKSDEDLSDLTCILKEFALGVPNVINLSIDLKTSNIFNMGRRRIFINLLTSYCPRLKEFIIGS